MPTIATLPNQATQDKRQAYLEKMKQAYRYQYSYNETFATVVKLPEWEEADCRYRYHSFKNLGGLIPSLPRMLSTQIKHWLNKPIKSYDEYLFFGRNSFSDTRFLDNFQSDEYFGLQRVIGINHVLLQGVSDSHLLPVNLDLSRLRQYFKQLTDMELDQAISTRRLFYLDYRMLQGLVDNPKEYGGRQQYLTAPIVVLFRQATGALMPIAIQLNQQANTENPVFMPMDGREWTAAKLFAQVADVTYQEFVTHATRIHYLVESFVIATYQSLYKTHPVFLLLKPHLRYTLSVNAHHLFLKDKKGVRGDFGAQMAGDYDAMVSLMSEAFKTYDFGQNALPADLARRQLDNVPELFYPYASEGRQIWYLIRDFVSQYLTVYYTEDPKVLHNDREIQQWAHFMSDEDGMRVTGFPERFNTLDELIEVVTQIIFITTAHHSTVHYPQYLFSGFTPAMPFAAYEPAPSDIQCSTVNQEYLLETLPLRQPAMTQAFIFYLTNYKLESIGQYGKFEAKVQPLVEAYQQKLADLAKQLSEAETSRIYPYRFLNPTFIPNSVMV